MNERLVRVVYAAFGGTGQVVVGVLFVLITIVETIWWLAFAPATVLVVFIVSMEALGFAAYGTIATGLAIRATERVEDMLIQSPSVETQTS